MPDTASSRHISRLTQIRTRLVRVIPKSWRLWVKRFSREVSPRGQLARKDQNGYLGEVVPAAIQRAVVFLVVDRDQVNGGILSIFSLAQETTMLSSVHGARVELATLPGRMRISRYTRFSNDRVILELPDIVRRIEAEGQVLLHVPEVLVADLVECQSLLNELSTRHLHINILLQNIDLAPARSLVDKLADWADVTITTAHEAYATTETADRFGVPLHHLSVYINPESYARLTWSGKEKLVVVSPDYDSRRSQVLNKLRREMPEYRFVTISGMTYAEYLATIARARFALTFGEGLDSYFIETVFTGGLGVAVFNPRFFPERLRALPHVYTSWDDLVDNLPSRVREIDVQEGPPPEQAIQYEALAALYSFQEYRDNLRQFYLTWFRRNAQ